MLVVILLAPIWQAQVEYPFYVKNTAFIIIGVMLVKHIFFLKYTWLNNFQKLKILFIPLSIPMILILIRTLNSFTAFADQVALAELMPDLSFERQRFLSRYIKAEFIIVAVVAISAGILFPFRLLVSVWREVNNR